MSDKTEGWFDQANREAAPSAKLKDVGDSVKGEVVDKFLIDYVPYAQKEVLIDDRTGEKVQQLAVVLQTDLRNWEGVSKIPTDKDTGVELPASKDTGRRALYARKGTNIYSALGKAISTAGAKDLELGGKFGVQLYELEDTGKGNPLKKHRAKYEPPAKPAGGDEWFDDASSGDSAPADKPAASDKPKSKSSVADDEPPF